MLKKKKYERHCKKSRLFKWNAGSNEKRLLTKKMFFSFFFHSTRSVISRLPSDRPILLYVRAGGEI